MNKKIESLDVTQINIVDKNGRVRGTLGLRETAADNHEPCLTLYDSSCRERLVCGINDNMPFVRLILPDGSTSIGIGSMHEEVKGISINTEEGFPAIDIQVQNDGVKQINFYGNNGERINTISER